MIAHQCSYLKMKLLVSRGLTSVLLAERSREADLETSCLNHSQPTPGCLREYACAPVKKAYGAVLLCCRPFHRRMIGSFFPFFLFDHVSYSGAYSVVYCCNVKTTNTHSRAHIPFDLPYHRPYHANGDQIRSVHATLPTDTYEYIHSSRATMWVYSSTSYSR